MKKQIIAALATMLSFQSFAQLSDTIPGRYRGYHYTEWYDQCPAYSNGGIIDSCFYEYYVAADNHNGTAKYEYTDHPILVRGLAALIRQQTYPYGPYLSNDIGPQYLYLLKRIDYEDTITPPPYVRNFRMRILDSIRFDTIQPKIMAIPQAYPGIPDLCVYVYEAYFEKPIQVDSDFYIFGSSDNIIINETDYSYYTYRPFDYAAIAPRAQWLCSRGGSNNYCHPLGHHHTMAYFGHSNLSSIGYPQISGNDVWCQSTFQFPDDPYGLFFAIVDHYELKLYSDSLPMGSVMGSGYYDENDTAECLAIPNPGFVFWQWNDGNTQNPRHVQLSQDTAFTAFFAEGGLYHLSLESDNPGMGTVHGGGDYPTNSIVSISATPTIDAYAFSHWNDGNTLNPRTLTLTQDTSFTAFFTENWHYHVELHSGMPDWGTVEGEGDYLANSQVTISASPTSSSYAFLKWSDNDTNNPRTFTITQDTVFVALFQRSNNISETPADDLVRVTPNPAAEQITIASTCPITQIEIITLSGKSTLRQEAGDMATTVDISSLPAGTYMVRIQTTKGTAFKKLVVR